MVTTKKVISEEEKRAQLAKHTKLEAIMEILKVFFDNCLYSQDARELLDGVEEYLKVRWPDLYEEEFI